MSFKNELFGEDSSWLSIADLMSILMFLFMAIAIFSISKNEILKNEKQQVENKLKNKEKKIKELNNQVHIISKRSDKNIKTINYVLEQIDQKKTNLYQNLFSTFETNLDKWNAEIDSTLSIKFIDSDVLFETGESTVKINFEHILHQFFPLFIKSIWDYKEIIDCVIIEGHTSSEWENANSQQIAYLNNMELSHDRARHVLEYCLIHCSKDLKNEQKEWIKKNIMASGFSSSRIIYDKHNIENKIKSRRVEFRIKTNSEIELHKILNQIKDIKVQD